MKILIHAVGANMGGGLRHIRAFVSALAKIDSQHKFVLLTREGVLIGCDLGELENREFPDRVCTTIIQRLKFDQFEVPRILKAEKFDICVSLLNFGPIFCPRPHVIFQRNALYFDKEYLRTEPFNRRFGNYVRGWLAGMSVVRADLVVAPSRTMKKLLLRAFSRLVDSRVVVLYHGFDRKERVNLVEANCVRQTENSTSLKIFYPSHFARHKGYDILLDVVENLVERDVDFNMIVTASSDYWPEGFESFRKRILSPKFGDRITNIGNVPQSEIQALYADVDVFFFPSLCESFGFPMLEAMGARLPMVVSDIEINREICGQAAEYYTSMNSRLAADLIEKYRSKDQRIAGANRSANRLAERDWSWDRYCRKFDRIIYDLGMPNSGDTSSR